LLTSPTEPDATAFAAVGAALQFPADDWARLWQACGSGFWSMLRTIAAEEKDLSVGLLGGRHTSYAKLFDRWWEPLRTALANRGLLERPLYLVSSNLHSMVNLASGYCRRRAGLLWAFLDELADEEEARLLRAARGTANAENLLYYAARLWHRHHPRAE